MIRLGTRVLVLPRVAFSGCNFHSAEDGRRLAIAMNNNIRIVHSFYKGNCTNSISELQETANILRKYICSKHFIPK